MVECRQSVCHCSSAAHPLPLTPSIEVEVAVEGLMFPCAGWCRCVAVVLRERGITNHRQWYSWKIELAVKWSLVELTTRSTEQVPSVEETVRMLDENADDCC